MKIRVLTAVVAVVTSVTTSQAGVYSLEVIPNHPTDRFTVMSSINDHGIVVGESYGGTFTSGPKRVVSYQSGAGLRVIIDNLSQDGMQFLPRFNNSGQITYTHNLRPAVFNDLIRTYRYSPGIGTEELASPNPLHSYVPLDMNEGGDVLGQSLNSSGFIQNSVVWRTNAPAETLHSSLYAIGIADDRTLLGYTPSRGFLRREGQNPEYQTYPGSRGWTGGMNSSGQILGGYSGHTWIWAPDLRSHNEIPIDSGRLLNDGSVIGGQRWGTSPLLSIGKWSPDGGYEIVTEMLDSAALAYGFDRWGFRSVNQRGEILATAWIHDPNNEFYEPRFNVILRPQPVPEPGTVLALGAGLAALLRRKRTT